MGLHQLVGLREADPADFGELVAVAYEDVGAVRRPGAGATSTTWRTLTAATAGGLALLGALLGTTGAYLALAAGHLSDLGTLSRVPLLYLAITVLGVPVAAALTA